MRKIFYSILLLGFAFLFVPRIAYAHFYAIDKTITVILHVDPNDSPVPEENATLYFDIGDATKRFKLTNCDCILTITEGGKQLYQSAIKEQKDKNFSIWGSNVPFIFPQRDVYHIMLSGKPLSGSTFQSFTVAWYFRVDQYPPVSPVILQTQALHKQSDPTFIYFAVGFVSIILLFGIGVFWIVRRSVF